MTLEELKSLLDAALVALKADPENAELKSAALKAQTDYDAKLAEEEDEGEPFDESTADPKLKKHLKKLRDEAAKARLKNKDLASKFQGSEEKRKAILKAAGIVEDDETPEEKLKVQTEQTQNLALRNAILETAVQHGIPSDGVKYYEFLINDATSELGEGEELEDEALAAIVAKVKKTFGSVGGKANSSTKGGDTPHPAGAKEITLDKFVTMSMAEKGKLYATQPELYSSLMTQAKQKKRLV